MKKREISGYVAVCMNEHVIKKVGSFIKRREKVLANTHRHCFKKLSNMIEETNHQITYTADRPDFINEVEDINSIRQDNLSSVPEPKMVSSPKRSEPNSSTFRSKKSRKDSFAPRQRRSVTCHDLSFYINEANRRNSQSKASNKPTGINTIVPL